MDTYRVPLPHPQPVPNEEEFVTNTGRRIKMDSELERPHIHDDPDMLGSGLSILSPSPGDSISARDGGLSNIVQAELHLSLDRLSENYDRDDIKRLQEKSKSSKRLLSVERNNDKKTSGSSPKNKKEGDTRKSKLRDSLDAEEVLQTPVGHQLESENYLSGEKDDEGTVVADSLNYSSSREGVTPDSRNSVRSIGSRRTPTNSLTASDAEDKYADLRYNPNWRRKEAQQSETSPVVIDFNAAPKLEDSLDQPQSSQRGGGAIVMHKKELYSPVIPDWGKESIPVFSSRSVSPTRLSTDPVRLQQTNKKYEEEFTRMLQAEILDSGVEKVDDFHMQDQNEMTHTPTQQPPPQVRENHSVLIRRLDSQDKRFSNKEAPRLGGYQLLPDRHRIPSPSRGPSVQERSDSKEPKAAPLNLNSQGRYRSPEGYLTNKKDPLLALSPRDMNRTHPVPTPPKMPKPKDYIEMNKQRVGRKTNSAGYLELHKKRARQTEHIKARSYSELKGAVGEHYGGQMPSPEAEYGQGTIEHIWSKQTERLKVAKGENVNKGKVPRPLPRPRQNGPMHGETFLVSPNTHKQYWDNSATNLPRSNNDWFPANQEYTNGALDSRMHLHNNRDLYRIRPALPVPSRQVPQLSPQKLKGQLSPNKEELMDSLNEAGFRRAYFSPRMHHGTSEQESPMMKAFHSKFSTEMYEPPTYQNRDHVLRQHFSEQNLALPPQQTATSQAEVWTNPNDDLEFSPTKLPPSNYSTARATRKVTFLGDNQPIAIEGISNGDPIPSPAGTVYGINGYRVPLPPTPPSKSLRHGVDRGRWQLAEKENGAFDSYYDVREDHYPVLPPILKSQHNANSNFLKQSPKGKDAESHDGRKGSYLEQHEKQKKKFHYKIYTLSDYQNLKKDVKLGGLGPDLEGTRAKMEKAERAKNYAELIRKEHMSGATTIKPKEGQGSGMEFSIPDENYHFSATMDEKQRRDMMKKRKRALEYSKLIPKPRPKPNPSPQSTGEKPSGTLSTYSSNPVTSEATSGQEGVDFNFGLLQMLKDRHEKEKAQVATFTGSS